MKKNNGSLISIIINAVIAFFVLETFVLAIDNSLRNNLSLVLSVEPERIIIVNKEMIIQKNYQQY